MEERDYYRNKLDSDGKFWISLWALGAAVVITTVTSITLFHHFDNIRRMEGWMACVNAGGQPIDQQFYGNNLTSFTCIKR